VGVKEDFDGGKRRRWERKSGDGAVEVSGGYCGFRRRRIETADKGERVVLSKPDEGFPAIEGF